MTGLRDLLLPAPIGADLIGALLFATFTLHMLFVLLMLGTAMLAMGYFLHAWWTARLGELRWDKVVLRTFMIHKSLAVVLGVGPLLLIQVGSSVPFFTAVALFSPFWMLIIAFLILSFISFDSLGHRIHTHRYLHLGIGLVAMAALLCVPGFFVAVLTASENPGRWNGIALSGFGFDWRLSAHWLMRYLHVLGAAVVFGTGFHYFLLARGANADKRPALLRWMVAGAMFQVVVGFGLYLSLLQPPTTGIYAFLLVGIALTGVLGWLAAVGMQPGRSLSPIGAMPLMAALLVAMLLARQGFQDTAFAAVVPASRQNAADYQKKLDAYHAQALARYQGRMNVLYSDGPTLYAESCAFCHGPQGRGNGPDAKNLHVPPEDISAVRAERSYVDDILMRGVDGSAMPRFGYYDRTQRERLLDYLARHFHTTGPPPRVPWKLPPAARAEAARQWSETCSPCHGPDGRGTKLAAKYQPPPPDMTAYSLTPTRALQVITDGYGGTMMPSFASLPEATRQGLVEVVLSKHRPMTAKESMP